MITVPTKAEVAKRLTIYRYRAGLTAREATDAIGKKETTLYKYEAAKLAVPESDLVVLLDFYGVDFDRAFLESESRDPASRKKDMDERRLQEVVTIWRSLSSEGRRLVHGVAKAASSHFVCQGSIEEADGGEGLSAGMEGRGAEREARQAPCPFLAERGRSKGR